MSGIILLTPHPASGQVPAQLQFDVATVKLAAPLTGRGTPRGGPGTTDPERVHYRYVTIKILLMTAYAMPVNQVTGPSWIEADHYDVEAKVPPGATKDQVNIMLQNLLADRFKLAVHRETRELSVYELVVGKGGAKLKPYVEDPNPPQPDPAKLIPMDKNGHLILRPGQMAFTTSPGGQRQIMASKQTVGGSPGLVTMLGGELGRPVIDKTGLTGFYDSTLAYRPQGPNATPPGQTLPPPSDSDAPDLLTAVQEQLGLKLEAKKGPVEILVVDSGDRTPTEN
jgi:uncharacterized protein (TIGR03435 family)